MKKAALKSRLKPKNGPRLVVTTFQIADSLGDTKHLLYGYDSSKRLSTVAPASIGTFTYGYVGASALVGSVTLPSSANALVSNAYDSLGRLTNTVLKTTGGTVLDSQGYSLDSANERSKVVRTAGRKSMGT